MKLCTKSTPKFFICELRGVAFITWVSEKDRSEALSFPQSRIKEWKELLTTMTGIELETIPELA